KIVKASLCIGVVHFGLMFVGMGLSSGSASIAILAQLHVSFVVASALAIGFGVVLIPGTRGIPIATLQAWMAVISLPPLLLLSGLFEHGQTAAIATAGLREWGVLAFVAIGATILGHGSWYFLLKRYSVTLIAAFTLLGPVFGVMSGGLFLGDRLTYEIVGGGVLVLFGIGMIQVWSVQKHEVTELGRGV
ncbi:MAG: hypothetical protein EXQ91_06850, partial [Alphaproteobacteria bacterium]|nr:hypothetical protein [Alphaproteobacteria bacterium]